MLCAVLTVCIALHGIPDTPPTPLNGPRPSERVTVFPNLRGGGGGLQKGPQIILKSHQWWPTLPHLRMDIDMRSDRDVP